MAAEQKVGFLDGSRSICEPDNEQQSNIKCVSIDKCMETRRIMEMLIYYQSFNAKQQNQENDILVDYCTNNKYKTLINDYNHMITHHNDIELIHDFIKKQNEYKQLLSCEFASCSMYKRSNRNRDCSGSSTDTNVSFIFWRDLLDQIHSFILHSFDSGIRIKKINYPQSTDDDSKQDEKKSDDTYFDSKLNAISVAILKKQKDLEKLNVENNRIITHKFDLNMNIDTKDPHFNVGFTFYYWPYYKNEKKIKQYWFNQNNYSGHNPSQLYIEPKYKSLKEEVLNNGVQSIKLTTYQQILQKAAIYIKSNLAKSIQAGDEEDDLHYGIKDGSPFTLEHLISIILYTDLSELSRSFSSTFRLLHPSEVLSSIKNRNREYWNWSKLIRETVECYGELMGFERRTPFYCGTAYMLISSYLIRLCSPTSTSKQLSVAYNFADSKGIVLQINNGSNYYGANLRFFNCQWISCYTDEDERLFTGGAWPIRVESVRLVNDKQNLQCFFKALFYFDCMVSGVSITSEAKEQISKSDRFILQKLIKQKLEIKENKFLKYINDCFVAFCNHKKQIVINQRQIAQHLPLFKDILFTSKESNMIKLDFACHLFTQCRNIIIYDDENQYQFDLTGFVLNCNKYIESSDYTIEQVDIRVWRGDNDEDTWIHIASSDAISISKQTELNDETWDVMVIKSCNTI